MIQWLTNLFTPKQPKPFVVTYSQITETYWNAKQRILTLYFKPHRGNPHYHDYHYRDGIWRKAPGMKKVIDTSINDLLNDILLNNHKGRGGSKSFA